MVPKPEVSHCWADVNSGRWMRLGPEVTFFQDDITVTAETKSREFLQPVLKFAQRNSWGALYRQPMATLAGRKIKIKTVNDVPGTVFSFSFVYYLTEKQTWVSGESCVSLVRRGFLIDKITGNKDTGLTGARVSGNAAVVRRIRRADRG